VNRRLSYTLVKREIQSRSRGSFAGSLWAILNPLLLMLTYFFVFGLVLKSRMANDPSPAGFALYLLAGMLPWLAFSEAVGRAPTVLIDYRTLIKKLVFPVEILPVNLVYSGLVGEAFGAALFILALLLIRGYLPWTVIFLPVLLIPQMLFTAAICWFLSALGVFLRDLSQFIGFFMTVWFFVTPICYPESQIPGAAKWILQKNPLYILVRAYRAVLLESRAPDWRSLGALTAVALLLAIGAHAWFYKLRKTFADVL
jgi:lipopolysaccharide transport system permease protein